MPLGRVQWLEAIGETEVFSRGMATATCEKALALVPKTGFILSTCTEMESKVSDSKNIAV